MSISQAVYEAQIQRIADLQARLAEAEALLREAREVIEALSEQQAMADDFYKPVLAKLDTYLAREKP